MKRWKWIVFVALLLGVGAFSSWMVLRPRAAAADGQSSIPSSVSNSVAVEYVIPLTGGIDRICNQPGTLEPFESADLYTKISGFLIEEAVDIGDAVKAGQVLARIAAPEYEVLMKMDAADLERTQAKADQAKAAITTAEADLGAAHAAIGLAQAERKSKESYRSYREKQRSRIQELVAKQAIDGKLADEQEDQYQAAVSADLAANEAITAAKAKEAASKARVLQAQADLKYAEAEVSSARARLEKTQVMLNYTVIRSPYSGVVTKRNFHPGDFVRSADTGGDRVPVFAVERTDIMRVIIQVPERDVPFVDRGDPAVVEFDALPGIVYQSDGVKKVEVTRLAASEDPHTRMMRTEVHLKNDDGKLRRGMYGRVALVLQTGASDALRIPSAAISGKADRGKATVRVVRKDCVCMTPIRYGVDNGSEVEVLSGLTANDHVIVRANGPIEQGTAVKASAAKSIPTAGH